MSLAVSENTLSVTVPFAVYWLTALCYEGISSIKSSWVDKYRLHAKHDEQRYNLVSRKRVILTVLLQHLVQMVLGLLLLDSPQESHRTYVGQGIRFMGAIICLDAWQYSFHRLFHEVEWCYKNIHIWHHKLFIPYPCAALYQHPIEMLIMDTLSGTVSVAATGCSPVTAMIFWSVSYFKTVSDHSGLKFPLNPTNLPGMNNAEYHDVHHAPTGLTLNYAQPFFTYLDRIFGTFKDPRDGKVLPARKKME